MSEPGLQASGRLAGWSLTLGFAVMLAGALLFISRPEDLVQVPAPARLLVERALIMLAVVLSLVGFHLLSNHLSSNPGGQWLKVGANGYLVAGVLVLAAEVLNTSTRLDANPLIVVYVVLALLAQAAVGVGIVHSESPSNAVGWITIAWNLAWPVILPLTTPKDMYFPVLHHLMPLAIGLSLLISR